MERATGDGSTTGGSFVPMGTSMVPATDAPAVNPAGLTPTPMTVDQDIFVQPVQAYFQFVQNNCLFLDESNIDQVRTEAEERHTQLMEQMVQQLCGDFEAKSIQMHQACMSELLQQRAEANQRHERDAAELSNYMLSRSVAEQEALNPRRELSDANTRLKNATNHVALEAEQCANQRVSQVARQYEERFAELRTSLKTECKKVVGDTISFAQAGMEGFRTEESTAMTELREECKRQESQAAEFNAQLQDRVDELMEKLNKYSAPMLNIEELGQDEEGGPVEVYAMPRAEHTTTAVVEPKPHETMSDLADHAKERLQSLFWTTPAGSNAPPVLPSLPVRQHPREESNREPSVRSPTVAASEPDMQKATELGSAITSQQLVELITRLTPKEGDGEKPRTKEAESIKLNDMPAPEAYRQWRNHVRDEVKSCSDKPDEAWSWLNGL